MSDTARAQTRDRLLSCNCHSPLPTPVGGFSLSVFSDMMYQVAVNNGFVGTKDSFESSFVESLNGSTEAANGIIVQKGSPNDFPEVGVENGIYIDSSTGLIYYWKNGGYYTVTAEISENTILNGGNA